MGVPLLIGLVHVAIVGRHYAVGSFDDDASYILSAQAILGGAGLTGHLTSGAVVVGAYPPLFPILLLPLVAIWPHSDLPLRLLSVGCFAALFPLTWIYLGRRRLRPAWRVATLVLLALNPVLVTFASMVMAEAPFLVLLLGCLLAIDRWDRSARLVCPAGFAVVVGMAGLVWFKEAALGLVVGLVLWLVLHRRVARAAVVTAGVAVAITPVVVARLVAGIPVTGSRYSQELGGYYAGGLLGRLTHVAPTALHTYFSFALPATIVPRGVPIPQLGAGEEWARVVSWNIPILCVVGLGVMVWRHRDAAVVMVPVYTAETLLWPYINERRVILVLPILVAWYVVGAWTVAGALVGALAPRSLGGRGLRAGLALLVAAVVVAPLVAQSSRDYLFGDGEDSSHPAGARYTAVLAATADRHTVVETDYESTLALDTGHPTANSAFVANLPFCVDQSGSLRRLQADRAGYLVVAALNKPKQIDSTCLLDQAEHNPWAVRLLHTGRDDGSVFELVGPGTAHPRLQDETAGAGASPPVTNGGLLGSVPGDPAVLQAATTSGQAVFTWTWSAARSVTQVSVGEARLLSGRAPSVAVEMESADGQWRQVATTGQAVGDGAPDPFVLVPLPAGATAQGLRVVISGSGRAEVADVHVLGGGS